METAATSQQPSHSATSLSRAVPPRWNVSRIDSNVRPAQAISDPFVDPFGDRQSVHQEPTLTLQPTQAESSIETLPPPRLRTPAAPRTETTYRAPTPTLTSTQLESLQHSQAPGAGITAPGQTAVPCDRIYNDRNCCDMENRCSDFKERLLAHSLDKISLDITPRYSPALTTAEENAEAADRLRLLELRPWRNRRGQVVATGRMTNILNGAVVVADESGKELARIPMHELGEDELCFVTAWWRLPTECGLGGLRSVDRSWIPSTFAWTASSLCHKPLYFEEVQLERYGHTAGPLRQPFISGAHFFLNLAALPYHMAINPPHECQYALGYYRPGSCAPWMIPPIPLSLRGAVAETGVILGGVYLIP
jgi:hypothetical protein